MFTYIENRRRSMAPINLYLSLIKNNYDFQNRLANMICDYANEIYKFEIIEKLIEKYREEYADLVANSQLRWSGKAYSLLDRLTYVDLNQVVQNYSYETIEDINER